MLALISIMLRLLLLISEGLYKRVISGAIGQLNGYLFIFFCYSDGDWIAPVCVPLAAPVPNRWIPVGAGGGDPLENSSGRFICINHANRSQQGEIRGHVFHGWTISENVRALNHPIRPVGIDIGARFRFGPEFLKNELCWVLSAGFESATFIPFHW